MRKKGAAQNTVVLGVPDWQHGNVWRMEFTNHSMTYRNKLRSAHGSQEENVNISLMSNGCGHFVPPLFRLRLGWMGDSTQGGSQ